MFASVEIKDGVLYFNAYGVDENGTTNVDRFAIQKDKTQGEVVPDYKEAEEAVNDDEAKSFILSYLDKLFKIIKVVFRVFLIYIVKIDF